MKFSTIAEYDVEIEGTCDKVCGWSDDFMSSVEVDGSMELVILNTGGRMICFNDPAGVDRVGYCFYYLFFLNVFVLLII